MRIISLLSVIFLFCFSVCGQTFNGKPYDLKKYNFEKENVLNVILNSPQFDSIYHSENVIFVETELLSKDTTLKLKRGNCKAKIKSKKELKANEENVGLGDFTCDPNNMIRVRVQIENTLKHLLLNLGMEKVNGKWTIANHVIMEN